MVRIPPKAKIALPLLIVLLNVAIIVASASLVMARLASINLSENFAEEITQAFTTADAIALIAAAASIIGSTVAAGVALKAVATAGFAACVERPELRTWMLLFGGLAEGIAIYGLLVAILILGKI